MSWTIPSTLGWIVLALAGIGWLGLWLALRSRRRAKRKLRETRSRKRSQSTRYGQLTEQFAPWMDGYPFDPERFRFLGDPVDGVQFDDEAVYLVEIKAAGSRRTREQSRVRELVREGRVGWVEFRASEDGGAEIVEPWRR